MLENESEIDADSMPNRINKSMSKEVGEMVVEREKLDEAEGAEVARPPRHTSSNRAGLSEGKYGSLRSEGSLLLE